MFIKNFAFYALIITIILSSAVQSAFSASDTSWASKNEYKFSQRKQKSPVNLYSPASGAPSEPAFNHGSVTIPTSPSQYGEPMYFPTMPSSQYGAKFNFSPSQKTDMNIDAPSYQEHRQYTNNNQNVSSQESVNDLNDDGNQQPYETPNVPPLYQNFE